MVPFLSLGLLLSTPAVWAGASRDMSGDDTVTFGTLGDWNPTVFSVCAWVDPDSFGESNLGRIADKASAGSTVARLGLRVNDSSTGFDNESFVVSRDGAVDEVCNGTESSVSLAGGWHFLCGTCNGTTCSCYRGTTTTNAVDVTGNQGTLNTAVDVSAMSMIVGSNVDVNRDFDGRIAYVHFYDRVLTLAEIQQLQWRPFSITDGQKLFAPLWGDTTELDLSGNGATGTVSGSTASTDGPPVLLQGGSR